MLTAREASLAAEAWVRQEAVRTPGFVGALLVGSIRELSPTDPYPPGSDVDVWVIVEGPVPDARRDPPSPLWPDKFAFRGAVLERGYFSWKSLRDPAAVLADPNLGPTLARAGLLSDPSGHLAGLTATVAAEYPRRSWARLRLEGAVAKVAEVCAEVERVMHLPTDELPPWRAVVFQHAVHLAACLPAVAALRRPTVRRSLVLAREVLEAHGRADLAEALLGALGSVALGRAEAERVLAELEPAYDRAAAVHRTRFGRDWNVSPAARPLAIEGIRELLETHHREAMSHAHVIRGIAQEILENDAPEAERVRFREGYLALLSALDMADEAGMGRRFAALMALLPALREAAESMLPAEDGQPGPPPRDLGTPFLG